MFITEVAIASILRTRSCCIVLVLLINSSSFSLLFLKAPIIEVTPTASVVHAAKTSAGLSGLGSGTFSLCLGERDRSCSTPSRSITGDLLCSSWCPCKSGSPCSEPDSKVVPCPGSGRFSVGGTSLGTDAFAIKLSRRRVRAWCTRCERPGPRYSLGMLRRNSAHHRKTRIHLSLSFILRRVPHTLIDDSHFRSRSHSLLPRDACRTSWQVMCGHLHFDVSDKNEIVQTDGNMQNSLTPNCQCMHNSSHECKTDHSGFCA